MQPEVFAHGGRTGVLITRVPYIVERGGQLFHERAHSIWVRRPSRRALIHRPSVSAPADAPRLPGRGPATARGWEVGPAGSSGRPKRIANRHIFSGTGGPAG
jgi:hypothetical protein